MDALIRAECAKLIEDWKQKAFAYDGLIYMMLLEEPEGVVPLYIASATTPALSAKTGHQCGEPLCLTRLKVMQNQRLVSFSSS